MEQFHYYTNDYLDDVYITEMEDNFSLMSNSSSDNDALPDTAAERHITDDIVTPDNSNGFANVRNNDLSKDSHFWPDSNQSSSSQILWNEPRQGLEQSKERPCQNRYNQGCLTWSYGLPKEGGAEGITSEPDPEQQNFGSDIWGVCEDMGQNILRGSFSTEQAEDSTDAAWSPSVLDTVYDQRENPLEPGREVPVESPGCASEANRGEVALSTAGVPHSKGLNQMPWSSKSNEFSFLKASPDAVLSLYRKEQPCHLQEPSKSAPFQPNNVQNSHVVGQSEMTVERASALSFPQKYLTQAHNTSLPDSAFSTKFPTYGHSCVHNNADKNALKLGINFPSTIETRAADLHPSDQAFGASDFPAQGKLEHKHPEKGHSSLDNLDSDHSSAPDSGQFWRMVQESCDAGSAIGHKCQEPDAEATGNPKLTDRPEINSLNLVSMPLVDLLSGLSLNPGGGEDGLTVNSSQDQSESGVTTDGSRKKTASASQLQQKLQSSSVANMQLSTTSTSSNWPVQGSEGLSDLVPGKKKKSGAMASPERREQGEDEDRHFGMIPQLSSHKGTKAVAASVSLLQQKSQSSSVSSMQLSTTSTSSSWPVQGSEEKLGLSDLVSGKKKKSGAKTSLEQREQGEAEVRHFGMIPQLSSLKGTKAVEDKGGHAAHLETSQPGKRHHVKSQGSGSIGTDGPFSQDINSDSSQSRSEPGVVGLQNPVPGHRKGPCESRNLGTSKKGQLGSVVPNEAPQDTVMRTNYQCLLHATSEVKQNAVATQGAVFLTHSKDSDDSTACDSMAVERMSPSCLSSPSIPYMSCTSGSLSTYSPPASMAMACRQSQMAIKDQALTEANLDMETVQRTSTLEEAEDILSSPEYHRVILNGLPGSGKRTLARTLLRRCRGLENTPLFIIKSFKEWREHVGGGGFGQDQRPGMPQVLLLDHIFGRGMLRNLEEWRQVFDVMTKFCEQGKTRLIFTFYPHVLQALQEIEPSCKLFSKACEVKMKDLSLDKDEKENILRAHLQSNQDAMPYLNSLLQIIDKEDKSGEMFPECCRRLADFISAYHPPSRSGEDIQEEDMHFQEYLSAGIIFFSRPSPVYKDYFLQLLHEDSSQRELLLAAFSFLLNGMDLTDMHSGTSYVAERCHEHGFSSACSQVRLLGVLVAFCHTLVAKDCRTFVNRMAYEGVALAIAQHHASLVILMADWPFLVKRCDVPLCKAVIDDTIKPFVMFVLTVKRLNDAKTRQTSEYQALVKRLALGLINPADMVWAVQHKALQSLAFTEDMMKVWKSGKENATVLKILSETFDSTHSLPLLYWSLFNDSPFFFHWIIKTVCKRVPQRKEDLVLAAYACCVLKGKSEFLKLLLKYWNKLMPEEVDHLLAGKQPETHPVFLPLPDRRMCLTQAWMLQLKHFRSVQKCSVENNYTLTYETSKSVASNSSRSLQKVGGGGGVGEEARKEKGREDLRLYQPPLHVAVLYENPEVVDLLAERFLGQLRAKDYLGQTALHVAAGLGQMDMVQTLLRHCQDLPSVADQLDNYPLHVACQQDQAEVVQLLLKADSRVAKFKNRFNFTPVDLAPDLFQTASIT